MARIRSIKPELRTSITVSAWPREVRYFFVLLWGYLDDYGRGVDDEMLIASDCFPRDRDITPDTVDAWLELLADSGPLCRYEVDGRRYLHCPNWREHQKPQHPTRSKIPPCPDDEPEDFETWRKDNPERFTRRSRKAREELRKIPTGLSGVSQKPSGGPFVDASGSGIAPVIQLPGQMAIDDAEDDVSAGEDGHESVHESLVNDSGNAQENFTPEQGSKGAREQGSKGEGGAGGNRRANSSGPARDAASRPDGLPPLHELPEDFALNSGMRTWASQNYPRVDVDHETQKFIHHWRSEGRRKRNWYEAWKKWITDANQYLIKHGAPRALPATGTDGRPVSRQQQETDEWTARAMARAQTRMQQTSTDPLELPS